MSIEILASLGAKRLGRDSHRCLGLRNAAQITGGGYGALTWAESPSPRTGTRCPPGRRDGHRGTADLPRMRRRLEGPEAQVDFPVLQEFRAQGATDRLGQLVGFGEDRQPAGLPGMLLSWVPSRALTVFRSIDR